MRHYKLLLLLGITALAVTGCSGKKETPAPVTEAVADTGDSSSSDEEYEDTEDYDDEAYDEEETDSANPSVKINFKKDEDDEKVEIPVEYFMTLGKVIKQADGYSIVQEDGTYLTDAIVPFEDHVFYFNSDGILTNDEFVKAYASDGKTVVKKYIHNYSYQYGFIQKDNKTYYVDEEQGLLTSMAVQIDGKSYYFDDNGKSISEDRYNTLYKNKKKDKDSDNVNDEAQEDNELTDTNDNDTTDESETKSVKGNNADFIEGLLKASVTTGETDENGETVEVSETDENGETIEATETDKQEESTEGETSEPETSEKSTEKESETNKKK